MKHPQLKSKRIAVQFYSNQLYTIVQICTLLYRIDLLLDTPVGVQLGAFGDLVTPK